MTALDYLVTFISIVVLLGSGFWFARRGQKSMASFVLGNRSLPWWLGGSAMVAGGSNVDSPLHQSGKIQRDGLSGAWFYWSQVVGQSFASVVFSRLWRRTGLNTVVEFYEMRYSRSGGVIVRIWSACYTSFVEGTLQLALGLVAMLKLCTVLLGTAAPLEFGGFTVPVEVVILIGGVALALAYSTAAGLMGVVAGDVLEFVLALAGSYALLFVVYKAVGGPTGLEQGLIDLGRGAALDFTPSLGISLIAFFVVQSVAMACGTNNTNQRFLAIRDEREAVFSGVWRVVNHFFFRTWPWYLCGLAALVLFAGRDFPREEAYPMLVREFLPSGVRGLLFAGFVVAFMSSVGSLMHASGSVFTNDLYRPYIARQRSEKHYVMVSRLAMVMFAIIGIIIALSAQQILSLLQFFMKMVAAVGVVWLLRWFWWRVNAWADLSAQIGALPITLFYEHGPGRDWVISLAGFFGSPSPDDTFGASYILSVSTTTVLWMTVMFLTPPEPMEKLCEFYRRVRPYGWWGPVARLCPEVQVTDRVGRDLLFSAALLGISLSLLFGAGCLFLAKWSIAAALFALGAVIGWWLIRAINRTART
jgi:SSS family solute:Na+ symporter